MNRENSGKRQLAILLQLLEGQCLNKKELETTYKVAPRTIQHDIKQIKSALDEALANRYDLLPSCAYSEDDFIKHYQIQTDKRGHYYLKHNFTQLPSSGSILSNIEALVLLKILLKSRGLVKTEMDTLITKLTHLSTDSVSLKERIRNEQFHYEGVPNTPIFETLELINYAIEHKLEISFDYTKNFVTHHFRKVPEQLYFQDLYFYMATDNHCSQDDRDLAKLNKFRVNNMENITLHEKAKGLSPQNRFQAGILRNESGIWGYFGNSITLTIEFFYDPVYVLNRFPKAVVTNQYFDEKRQQWVSRINIPTNDGYGVKMWLLMQSDQLKIISPKSLRDYVIQSAKNMLSYYENDDKQDEKA